MGGTPLSVTPIDMVCVASACDNLGRQMKMPFVK